MADGDTIAGIGRQFAKVGSWEIQGQGWWAAMPSAENPNGLPKHFSHNNLTDLQESLQLETQGGKTDPAALADLQIVTDTLASYPGQDYD